MIESLQDQLQEERDNVSLLKEQKAKVEQEVSWAWGKRGWRGWIDNKI